jgi:hypothetical protein
LLQSVELADWMLIVYRYGGIFPTSNKASTRKPSFEVHALETRNQSLEKHITDQPDQCIMEPFFFFSFFLKQSGRKVPCINRNRNTTRPR